MRCLNNEGVNLSHLGHPPPSSPPSSHPHHPPGLHDVIMATTVMDDVITSSPRASDDSKPSSDSYPLPTSPQLSPVSTKSDSDLTLSGSPVLKDFTTMSISSRLVRPRQFSALSSPELSHILLENLNSKRGPPSSGMRSASYVSAGDSESEAGSSSRTSTARNTLSSSGSSLYTTAEELSSNNGVTSSADVFDAFDTSEGHRDERMSGCAARGRGLSEGRVRFEDDVFSDHLRRHRCMPGDILHKEYKVTDEDNGVTKVQLPERYRQALRKSGSYGNVGGCSRKGSWGVVKESGEDLTSRKKDLGTALAWIRQEMVQMKEQDKVLLKRFIELRASILQLRCMYGSSSSVCSMDGSSVSLNEVRKSTRMRSADSDAMLAERLHSASSSLSLPCSPQLSRLRWRSDEL